MSMAENWQKKLAKSLSYCDVLLLNPHRDDWDSFWTQSKDNAQLREQSGEGT
jgi:hypothetical protein